DRRRLRRRKGDRRRPRERLGCVEGLHAPRHQHRQSLGRDGAGAGGGVLGYSNTTRLCGDGGSGVALTFAKPASRPICAYSRSVYASPCGVPASITRAKAAANGGDTRSSLGTNSTASARPPGVRLARTFTNSCTQVAVSK